ncbi:MAG: aspartate/glutamate racemase family protein [Pseudomonadota bacterium]
MRHLGIVSLDTAFPRIFGDAGNPDSYPFPVQIKVVNDADASVIVSDNVIPDRLTDAFVEAATELEAAGAGAIISTCGFLIHAQKIVAQSVRIPVMLSPLSLYPIVQSACPGTIGILTASANALGSNSLAAAGICDAVIAGMDQHVLFCETFLALKSTQRAEFDPGEMERLVLAEACKLASQHTLSALLLECGNLGPYADALRSNLDLPVFSILDAATFLMETSSMKRQPL